MPAMVQFHCRLRHMWQAVRLAVDARSLALSMLFISTFLLVEYYLQEPFVPGRYLLHRDNARVMQMVESERDARIPHAVPVVPRIVHFTWGARPTMRFHEMMSILSAYHIIRPNQIFIWYSSSKPSGIWWKYLRRNITDVDRAITFKFRQDPTEIFGHKIRIPEHKSDVVRLEAVMEHGGIYMDTDVIALKSFDPLLYYDITMGMEGPNALCNGIIISRPNATFLHVWKEEYRSFNDGMWGMHSVYLPYLLSVVHPKLVNVEEKSLNRPNWSELEYIYGSKKYNWRENNYAMHLWYRKYNVEHDFDSIQTLDNTLGEMFRYILYGTPELR